MAAAAAAGLRPCLDGQQEGTLRKPARLDAAVCNGRARPSPGPTPLLQVLFPLLLSEDNVAGWPGVVVEDITRQAHQLKNEMFVMGGKIQGKPLLPLPEYLDSQDGSSTILDRWGLQGPGAAQVPLGGTGAGTPARSPSIPGHRRCSAAEHLGEGPAWLLCWWRWPQASAWGSPGAVQGQSRCWT